VFLSTKNFRVSKSTVPRGGRQRRKKYSVKRQVSSYERDFLLVSPISYRSSHTYSEVGRSTASLQRYVQHFSRCRYHEAASCEDVYLYGYEDGPGPDLKNLTFNTKNRSKTPWNSRVINLLLGELRRRGNEERWPFARLEVYFRSIL
jgi:hypothetical protein